MDSLDVLAARIERVARGPDAVEGSLLLRLARPLLTVVGYAPRVRLHRTRVLLAALASKDGPRASGADVALVEALRELADNIAAVERAVLLNRRPMVAHAAWLGRLHATLVRASAALTTRDHCTLRLASEAASLATLAPLSLRAAGESPPRNEPAGHAVREPDASHGEAARLLALELAAVDHLLAAAWDEREVLARRRRLLEAARQVLLETSAALPLEREGVRLRQTLVAREVLRIDRLEAAGVSTSVALTWQAREALERGELPRLAAIWGALDVLAAAVGDGAVTTLCERGRKALLRDEADTSADATQRAMAEMFGDAVAEAVTRGYADGRAALYARRQRDGTRETLDDETAYLARGGELSTMRAAMAVGGCFELGGAMNPVRVLLEHRVARVVRHPTARMELEIAREVSDMPDALIHDPRAVLLDLAAGRLLTRRYLRMEVTRRPRTVLRTEARVFVLDGSGSMLGPRARMRDALLVAELATLIRRLEEPGDLRCAMWFRYFTDGLGPVTRVDTVEHARSCIVEVLSTLHDGGTDITGALVESLVELRVARERDPDLVRAQIVLVTDGEATVDEARILQARGALGDLPVAVSVLALGQENPRLRELVAAQRARGERTFYHFIDDTTLAEVAAGAFDDTAPPSPAKHPLGVVRSELGGLLDELESLGRARDLQAMERLDAEAQARRELGLDAQDGTSERELARLECLRRDRAALDARFARWFPIPPRGDTGARPAPRDDEAEAVQVALATVVEVVRVVGGSELSRKADAIEILERLLPDAGLTPMRYQRLLATHRTAFVSELNALHAAVRAMA